MMSSASVDKEKDEREWRVVGRGREKRQIAEHQSQHDPKVNATYSLISSIISKCDDSASYAATASEIQKNNEPSWEKIAKLRKFKMDLDAKQWITPNPLLVPGLSCSAMSSPT